MQRQFFSGKLHSRFKKYNPSKFYEEKPSTPKEHSHSFQQQPSQNIFSKKKNKCYQKYPAMFIQKDQVITDFDGKQSLMSSSFREERPKTNIDSSIYRNLSKEREYEEMISILDQENRNLKQQNRYLHKIIKKDRREEEERIKIFQKTIFQLQKQNLIFKQHFNIVSSQKNLKTTSDNVITFRKNTKQNISPDIKEMNDRFENIYGKYKRTHSPSILTQCTSIYKKIKELEQNNE